MVNTINVVGLRWGITVEPLGLVIIYSDKVVAVVAALGTKDVDCGPVEAERCLSNEQSTQFYTQTGHASSPELHRSE